MEYREKIYKSMLASQERYLKRKDQKKVANQKPDLISLQEEVSLYTVFPKNPNLALQKRKITKETRGIVSRVIDRYFCIDNEMITYFKKDRDVQFKKHITVENARVCVEKIQNKVRDRWHERKFEFRVAMELEERKFQPIYYYTNDLNEAKALYVRLITSGSP